MRLDRRWLYALLALVILGGVLYVRQGGLEAPEVSALLGPRHRACQALAGEQRERLEACLVELRGAPRHSSVASRVVDEIAESGEVLYVGGTPEEAASIEAHPELLEVLLGLEEEPAAEALREAKVRGLVVHRDLTGALDRDKVVLSRLAQHDHLEWFQLRYVTDAHFVYTVRRSTAQVPLGTGERLLVGLRERLSDRRPTPQTWDPGYIRLIGSVRLQGRTLAMRHSSGRDLERVLDDLAAKLRRRWEREVEVLGLGRLEDRLDDMRIEIHVVMERAPVEPRGEDAIFDLWEMGVDGMMFRHRDGVKNQKFTYMPGSEQVTQSIRSADAFLRMAVEQGGWRDARPWRDSSTRLDLIRTQHFMEREKGGGAAVRLVRGLPEVTMDEVTADNLREMQIDGGEWWMRSLKPDGSFLYKYWPAQNRESADYNEVRHILGTRDLAATFKRRADPRYLAGARRAMDWLLRHEVRPEHPPHPAFPHPPEGTVLFRVDANQKLGTVAVALLGWIEWAKVTGDHREDDRIREMARFVLSQAEPNGKFDPYYVAPGHSYYGQKNDIVPGEAALALAEVSEYFGEPEWIEFMPRFLDYYEPWWRERAPQKNPYGRWPHDTYDNQTRLDLVQFGPWGVMAMRKYYTLTGDERAAAFGLEIADWMIENYQWSEDRAPFPDYVGGYYKIPRELPAMQTFCYSEGTAAAYHIAALFRPEDKDVYDTSTREALRFLRVMQYDELDSYFVARPEVVHGGVKYAMNENKVRIDYVGHALSTIDQYLEARAADPAVKLALPPLRVEASAPYRPDLGAATGDVVAEAEDLRDHAGSDLDDPEDSEDDAENEGGE